MNVSMVLHAGRPERLMVIAAHPGDAEHAIAGTVARWVGQGTAAHLVCCTSGDAGADLGADDASTDPLELAATRESEQRAAAAVVGYEDVTFLHRPDGALANDLALREQLVRLIRSFRPDAVSAPDPRVFIHASGALNQVDHREAGAAAIDAVHPASANAMAFPHLVRSEGLRPHHVERLYLFGSDSADAAVDISATLETKLRALAAHDSQWRDGDAASVRVTDEARHQGERVFVEAAEAFVLIDLA